MTRAEQILQALAAGPRSAAEICRDIDAPRSTVSVVLSDLNRLGLIRHLEHGLWGLPNAPAPEAMRGGVSARRFWAKVDKNGPIVPGMTTPCWLWTGARAGGYGKVYVGGRSGGMVGAHRVAWEVLVGPIPDGLRVLHRCDNPPCVRADPDPALSHLFIGTQSDNLRDMAAKGRNPGCFGAGTSPEANHG